MRSVVDAWSHHFPQPEPSETPRWHAVRPAPAQAAAPAPSAPEPQPLGPPSVEHAKAEARRQRPKELNLWHASSYQIRNEFGAGIASYFLLLRTLGQVCAFSAATTYIINAMLVGVASEDPRLPPLAGPQALARLSLASFETLLDENGLPSNVYGPDTSFAGADKRSALLAISCLDCASTLALMGVLVWFARTARLLDSKQGGAAITLSDFSVLVTGLPRAKIEESELAAHLEAQPLFKGRIAKVSIARSYGEVWDLLAAKAEVEGAMDSLRAQKGSGQALPDVDVHLMRLRDELSGLNYRLHNFDADRQLVATCAFVTFESTAGRDFSRRYFPDVSPFSPLAWLHPRSRLFRGKHRLRMSLAGEPSAILHENLHFEWRSRLARHCGAAAATLCLLLCTTAFAFGAKSFENRAPLHVSCASLNSTLPCENFWPLANVTSDANCGRGQVSLLSAAVASPALCANYISATGYAWEANASTWLAGPSGGGVCPLTIQPAGLRVAQCVASVCQGCYCTDKGIGAWLNNDPSIGTFCDGYWRSYANGWALRGCSFLIIIVVNLALRKLMPTLTRFERPPTRAAFELSLAVKLLLALFFNSFVTTVLVDSQVVGIAQFPPLFSGPFSDYTPRWYSTVGAACAITAITQTVQPPIVGCLLGAASARRMAARARNVFTQREMDALFVGPEWELGARVASTLSSMWLSLALCAGLPWVGFLLPVGCFLCFWSDRYFLLRVARKPPVYDTRVVQTLCSLLLWGLWVHHALAAWQLGSPTLPAFESPLIASRLGSLETSMALSQFDVGMRLGRWQSLIQAVPFFGLSLWLFAYAPLRGVLWTGGGRTAVDDAADGSVHTFRAGFAAAVAHGRWEGPVSYDAVDEPRYADRLAQLHDLHHDAPLKKTSLAPAGAAAAPQPQGQQPPPSAAQAQPAVSVSVQMAEMRGGGGAAPSWRRDAP